MSDENRSTSSSLPSLLTIPKQGDLPVEETYTSCVFEWTLFYEDFFASDLPNKDLANFVYYTYNRLVLMEKSKEYIVHYYGVNDDEDERKLECFEYEISN